MSHNGIMTLAQHRNYSEVPIMSRVPPVCNSTLACSWTRVLPISARLSLCIIYKPMLSSGKKQARADSFSNSNVSPPTQSLDTEQLQNSLMASRQAQPPQCLRQPTFLLWSIEHYKTMPRGHIMPDIVILVNGINIRHHSLISMWGRRHLSWQGELQVRIG